MGFIVEQKQDAAVHQFEVDPFKCAPEFGSAVDTPAIDPIVPYFSADSFASSSDITDNAVPVQPLHELESDWQALDIPGMQNDAYTQNFSQATSFQDVSLALPASGDFNMMSFHSSAAAPFVNSYPNAIQSLDLDDPFASLLMARPFPPNSQVVFPMAGSLMRGCNAATDAYQYPQFAPMEYPTSHSAAPMSYFDDTMGYDIQPGPYGFMPAAAAPMVNPPLDQALANSFPVQQQPVADHSYDYFNTMTAMPPSQLNENIDFAGQGVYSEYLIPSSPPYMPTAESDSRGSPCSSDSPPRGDEGGVSAAQASSRELQHSSAVQGRVNKSCMDRRPRKSTRRSTAQCQRIKTESRVSQDGKFICRWGGCGIQLVDTSSDSFKDHLKTAHGIRTSGPWRIKCKWTPPESEKICGKLLQFSSLIKHVCGYPHLDLLSTKCPLCKLYQSRDSNITRHWLSCSFFIRLDEEEQKRLWYEYSPKPFDWYIEMQETRRRSSKN